jgi:hypothetical protein
MTDWREDNFLERLMPHRSSKHQALQESCPGAEDLCALAEGRLSGPQRDAIAAHTNDCPDCTELYVRLLEFARPSTRVPESEWLQAEKRIGNRLEVFLRAQRPQAPVPLLPAKAAAASRAWNWLGLSKLEWAIAFAATLTVTAALTFFVAGSPRQDAGQIAQRKLPAAEQKLADSTLGANTLPANQGVAAETPNTQLQGVPVSPLSTTEVIPGTATSKRPPVAAPRPKEPIAPSAKKTDVAPPRPAAAPPAPTSGPNITAAALSPEVKQSIADEVLAELAAEKEAAANRQLAAVPDDNHVPVVLDSRYRVFVVSRIVNGQTSDGQECNLTPGDVITRISDVPDRSLSVQVLVTTSQTGECSPGTNLAMSLQDLQDLHNDFRENLDSGLQVLADNAGKKGMPRGPASGAHANPAGVATRDERAQIELQDLQIEADNTEDEVARAAEGVAPSAFHPNRQPPNHSASLKLSAWDRTFWQSNSRQQQAPAPRAPAQNRPAPTPPARPANPQPAPHPPAPARPAPATNSKPAAAGARPSLPNRPAAPPPSAKPSLGRPPAKALGSSATGKSGYSHTPNRKTYSSRFSPPRDAKATPDGRGGLTYRSSKGEFHTAPNGKLSALKTPAGTEAKFNSRGGLASIHTAKGLTIHHSANGARRIESLHSDGTKVVSTGRNRGFVEHSFTHGGRPFVARTYLVNGRAYARVYGRYSYRGEYFYHYVPAYFYAPAFYGWAYNPWAAPVAWGWGWGSAPWYGYYGYYFSPAAYYPSPALWLTDFLLAANLQAAYDAQASSNNSLIPGDSSAENEFHAFVPAFDNGEIPVDDLRVELFAAVRSCIRNRLRR